MLERTFSLPGEIGGPRGRTPAIRARGPGGGGAPMRHTPVTAKLSSEQATGALAEGTYAQCPKPVPASQRGREAIARGLSDFILEQQGPETKATWGMRLRGVWSTPDARMWSEGLFVQQWERGWFLTGGGEARMLL